MRAPGQVAASTASMLVEGYCQDFTRLAASLAQTLEQVTMRGLPLGKSRSSLERVELGMRNLADAIAAMLKSEVANASAGEGAAAPGTCAIQGDVSSMPLTSVFQFLSRMRKTGTLRIRSGGEELALDLTDGCVEGTTAVRGPGETIGDVLVEMGLARRECVDAAADGHQGSEAELEAKLVRNGAVSAAQLKHGLEQLASRRIRRMSRAKTAEYAFEDGRRAPNADRVRIRMRFEERRR